VTGLDLESRTLYARQVMTVGRPQARAGNLRLGFGV